MGGENRQILTGTEIQRQVDFFIYFSTKLRESVPMQVCGMILMSCDVLCCVSVMMADLCVHTYACLSV